jgi:hypothetical protein
MGGIRSNSTQKLVSRHLNVTIAASVEDSTVQHFIDRWKNSGAAERANYQLFLSEL